MRSVFSLLLLVPLCSSAAVARERTIEENKMLAAAMLLTTRMQTGGLIQVDDGTHAHMIKSFDPNNGTEQNTFRKISDCVYAGRSDKPGRKSVSYAIVDFRTLSGAYESYRTYIFFKGEGKTGCFANGAVPEGACTTGLQIYSTDQQGQFAEDVAYIVKNGCGGANPPPN